MTSAGDGFDLQVLSDAGTDYVNVHNTFVKHDLLVDTGADTSNDTVNLSVIMSPAT